MVGSIVSHGRRNISIRVFGFYGTSIVETGIEKEKKLYKTVVIYMQSLTKVNEVTPLLSILCLILICILNSYEYVNILT